MRFALLATLALTLACAPALEEAPRQPNIIFLLVDDMGYADVAVYGNTYHLTPNIDQLAADGMRFTDAYAAAPNCSPTRGSIMTGRWPARNGVTQYLPGNVLPHAKLLQAELPARTTSRGDHHRRASQATPATPPPPSASGTWAAAATPRRSAASTSTSPAATGTPIRACSSRTPLSTYPAHKEGDYLTDNLTDAALDFIQANREQPFFLYLPYYAIHSTHPGQGRADRALRRPRGPIRTQQCRLCRDDRGRRRLSRPYRGQARRARTHKRHGHLFLLRQRRRPARRLQRRAALWARATSTKGASASP